MGNNTVWGEARIKRQMNRAKTWEMSTNQHERSHWAWSEMTRNGILRSGEVYRMPQHLSENGKDQWDRRFENRRMNKSAFNNECNDKSGYTEDETPYSSAHHDYSTYNTPTLTR